MKNVEEKNKRLAQEGRKLGQTLANTLASLVGCESHVACHEAAVVIEAIAEHGSQNKAERSALLDLLYTVTNIGTQED